MTWCIETYLALAAERLERLRREPEGVSGWQWRQGRLCGRSGCAAAGPARLGPYLRLQDRRCVR